MVIVILVSVTLFHAVNGIPQQPIKHGQGGTNGAPKVIPLARLGRGGEERMECRSALVFGQIKRGPVNIQVRGKCRRRRGQRPSRIGRAQKLMMGERWMDSTINFAPIVVVDGFKLLSSSLVAAENLLNCERV